MMSFVFFVFGSTFETESHQTGTFFEIDIEENRCITVSAGFITCSGSMNFEQTMEEVDKKLYLAKKAGKDRVIS